MVVSILAYAQAEKCPNVNGKSYVQDDCTKYNLCLASGKEVEESCPQGKFFNCLTNSCGSNIWPTCCYKDPKVNSYPVDKSCPTDGIATEDPNNCQRYFFCRNGQFIAGNCGSDEHFDAAESSCVDGRCENNRMINPPVLVAGPRVVATKNTTTTTTVKPQILCTRNGQKWANVDDCNSYFSCEYGNPKLKHCLPFFSWNCFQDQCSMLKLRECCANDPNVNKGWANNFCWVQGKTALNPSNGTQYFFCENHKVISKKCNGTSVYIPELYKCGDRQLYIDLVNSLV